MWAKAVTAISARTGITDPDLAQIVAQAVEDASSEFQVDPWIMAALIRVESHGDPNAVSHVGALGLTQIMPRTGRQIARELEIENYSTEMLFDPATNVRMGTYYISTLLARFGDLHAALAAYNWGPTHIARRISNQEKLPTVYPNKILRPVPEQRQWAAISAS
jgi:soluble lytic murein transglycosylase